MVTQFSAHFVHLVDGLRFPGLNIRDIVGLLILLSFATFFGAEIRWGRRDQPNRVVRHSYLTNLGMMVLNDILMSVTAIGTLYALAARYGEAGFLSHIANPAVRVFVSLLALDLVLYAWHAACHRFPWLWRFHRIHHSDLSVNVSTAFRLHFMELALTTLVKSIVVVTLGIQTTAVMISEAIITIFVMFHHANIRFPGERSLGTVFVVPYLHRAHHSQRRDEHDNNYGAVLSLWDRCFGTLVTMEPAKLGLANVPEQTLWDTVKHGFTTLKPPVALPVQAMIAEAAYYRAQRRGFQPGHEIADWIQAEREIVARIGRRSLCPGNSGYPDNAF